MKLLPRLKKRFYESVITKLLVLKKSLQLSFSSILVVNRDQDGYDNSNWNNRRQLTENCWFK